MEAVWGKEGVAFVSFLEDVIYTFVCRDCGCSLNMHQGFGNLQTKSNQGERDDWHACTLYSSA